MALKHQSINQSINISDKNKPISRVVAGSGVKQQTNKSKNTLTHSGVATQPPVLAADGILDRGGLLIEPSLVLNNKQTNSYIKEHTNPFRCGYPASSTGSRRHP